MQKHFFTLLILTIGSPLAYACSSFVLKNGNNVLLGKNFDWTFDKGYIIKNLKSTTKTAYCTHNGKAASWTSRYGSITFNQNGKDMPYGGMNEMGLVVEMLWLDETRFNISDDKTYLNELEWIQYQLDNFKGVDEVIAHIDDLKIYPIKGKIHYILADVGGKSVIIEYLDGMPKIYEKEANSCQAITNKPVIFSEKYIDNIQGVPKNNTSEIYRYHRLESQIRDLQGSNGFLEKDAFQLLESVRIAKGDFKTVWSIVYNLENKSISFFSHSHQKTKKVYLNNIDFNQSSGSFNINQDKDLVLDTKFSRLTEQANFKMVSASLGHLAFDKELGKDLSSHQFSQKLATSSWFSQNYFHFDIRIPMTEAGKWLFFVVMDSEKNFNNKVAVTGGYLFGSTSIGTAIWHIYGLKNGTYAMIAFIDENKNSVFDFDGSGNPLEKYAMFSDFKPKSAEEITFSNTSNYFTKDNARKTLEWR